MAHPRLQRLARAAVARAQVGAWALLALGCAAFVLLPLSGRRCYLDEKALLVGGALPTTRRADGVGGAHAAGGRAPPAANRPALAQTPPACALVPLLNVQAERRARCQPGSLPGSPGTRSSRRF